MKYFTKKLQLFFFILALSITLKAQDYEIKFDSLNASSWFGGDDRINSTRSVGVGQSVLIEPSITLESFAFYFTIWFDYAQNPTGHGNEVTLTLNIRDSIGNILQTEQVIVPDTFNAGWVTWQDINLNVNANTKLIFTTYLVGAFDDNQYFNGHGSDQSQPI